jgi:STE24 endopeptidase
MVRAARFVFVSLFALSLLALAPRAFADPPPPSAVEVIAVPSAAQAIPLDPEAATRAYLDSVPAEKRARSDAYFEGGYWIQLWSFLLGLAVNVGLLHTGASARMRDLAARVTGMRFVHTALYAAMYVLATSVLTFPFAIYTDWVRERAYGLSTMTFAAWLGDEAKGLAIGVVLASLFLPVLYAILRRATRTWWIWGAVVSIAFVAFLASLAPVYLAPIFNQYTVVTDETVRGPILRMAHANGIAASDIYQFDASRQSNRVSANVSGLFGTERISLNDNLLKRCTLPEIEAVLGHEMGHYVLHHAAKGVFFGAVALLLVFAVLRFGFDRVRARFSQRWKVTGIDDPAGLPLLALLATLYGFVLTPVFNNVSRTDEAEADIFGVNTSRQPDGMAQVALKLAEYRKLDPGPIEEILFYDHPSGRARIYMAMQWKAEHLGDRPPFSP